MTKKSRWNFLVLDFASGWISNRSIQFQPQHLLRQCLWPIQTPRLWPCMGNHPTKRPKMDLYFRLVTRPGYPDSKRQQKSWRFLVRNACSLVNFNSRHQACFHYASSLLLWGHDQISHNNWDFGHSTHWLWEWTSSCGDQQTLDKVKRCWFQKSNFKTFRSLTVI